MLQVQIIGHIGADARVEEANGNKFISFNVAHTDSWTGQDGTKHEQTTWVSCAMNGDGGNILQYLVKGKQVFVQGRLSTRVFSSPKERRMVAGINCAVDRIELIGGRVDEVPSQLTDETGYLMRVNKAFFITQDEIKCFGLKKGQSKVLMSTSGKMYSVSHEGWVSPVQEQTTDESKAADNAGQDNKS